MRNINEILKMLVEDKKNTVEERLKKTIEGTEKCIYSVIKEVPNAREANVLVDRDIRDKFGNEIVSAGYKLIYQDEIYDPQHDAFLVKYKITW